METLPAIILAGGRSTRMGGGDKGLRDLAGRPMIAHVAARIAGQCAPVALSANGDPARFAALGLPVLADGMADFPGPLAGILAGMDWAAGIGAGAVISVAADTPFLPRDLASRLIAARGPGGLALAASRDAGGRVAEHPTFGLWPVALRADLRAYLRSGGRRLSGFAEAHRPGIAIWQAGALDPFFNVNDPGDLALARAIAAGGSQPAGATDP